MDLDGWDLDLTNDADGLDPVPEDDSPLEVDASGWLPPLPEDVGLDPGLPTVGDDGADLPQWDGSGAVVGDPAAALPTWHLQEQPDTCAVAAQEFVLESVTGQEFDEADLTAEAAANGWYTPGGGTPLWATGELLESHGVEVEQTDGASIEDLEAAVAEGRPVIVGVDADEIWIPGQGPDDDSPVGDGTTIPGQDANHAVTVIGFDVSNPDDPMVILNDPGHPDGQGMLVPVDEFVDAWEDSDSFMVTPTGDVAQAAAPMSIADGVDLDDPYEWMPYVDAAPGADVRRW